MRQQNLLEPEIETAGIEYTNGSTKSSTSLCKLSEQGSEFYHIILCFLSIETCQLSQMLFHRVAELV